MGFRQYDPNSGRWLTRDPIGYAGGLNLYQYCGNDPVNFTDVLGLFADDGGAEIPISEGRLWALRGLIPFVQDPQWRPGSKQRREFSNGIQIIPGVGVLVQGWILISGTDPLVGCQVSALERVMSFIYTGLAVAGAGEGEGGFGPVEEGGGGCFLAGTPITVAAPIASSSHFAASTHTKPIERIQKGDLVATRNPKTGKSEFKQVEHAFVKTATKIAIVSLMDARTHHRVETLRGTLEHPFFTTQGTVPMGQLKPGMKVISRRGPPLVVQSVHRQGYPHGIAVYNFQVADDHSYFVGSAHGGTWVHNAGPDCTSGVIKNIRAAGSYDAPLQGSKADAIAMAKEAYPNAVQLPDASGEPYPSPPPGVKNWFQVHPAETPDIAQGYPHVKYADWTNGKKHRGGSWGHIPFK